MIPSLLTSLLRGEAGQIATRAKAAIVAYALVGVFGLLGLGFLLGAAYVYVRSELGPLYASLIFAAVFLAIALIIFVSFTVKSKAKKRRIAEQRRSEMAGIAAASALALVPALLRSQSITTLIGLPIAGFIASQIYRENFSDRPDDDLGDDSE